MRNRTRKSLSTCKNARTLEQQADAFHKELSELAKKSQELHESMIAKIAEAKKAKEEADTVQHKGFIENKEKIKTLLVDIAVLTGQMLGVQSTVREQNKEFREKENVDKTQRERAMCD